MSTAINKLQTLPELLDASQVGSGQELPDRIAPRNIQVGREIREPLEVERPQHTRMRNDEVRFFYRLLAEEQHVYVHCARGLHALRTTPLTPQSHLDPLAEAHKLDRRGVVLDLHDAVQVVWLLP